MTALIVDYAWNHPAPADISRVGYSGVARYLSHDFSKNLSGVERDQLRARDLSITLAWESTADRALAGALGGSADGADAARQANGLGFPGFLPIYYAVDFDANESQFGVIEQYLSAAGRASGRPVGVYGSLAVVDHMLNGGRATYGWQTAAWSGGRVSSLAHLYQRVAPSLPRIPGGYDEDVVLQASFGQWGGLTPPAPDHPEPSPHAPPITYTDDETGETVNQVAFDCGTLDGQGNAQVIWGGGQSGEPGVADFSPAIPYDKFRNCFVKGRFAPADGHTPPPGLPTWGPQMRDGALTIEFTGGVPGGKLDVEIAWAD